MLKRKTHPKPPAGSWTLMVYMVADDDDGVFTNDHIAEELKAIRAAIPGRQGARIAVQADIRGKAITRHFVDNGRLVDQDVPHHVPGSVGTIRDFILFGMDKQPADHYLVVFWGHGFGPAGLKYGRFVLPAELRKALREGFGLLKPVDIVALMSCQMNTIELAYEFSQWPLLPFTKVANHIVASQGSVQPNEPFPYDEVLTTLNSEGGNPTTVGTQLVDSLNTKNGVRDGVRFGAPFSLVDVASAKKVADALKALAPDIVATRPFANSHTTLSPIQEAMHDALDGSHTHDLSLLDLGHLGRRFGGLSPATAANAAERMRLQRLRAAGTQLSEAVEKAFVLRRQAGENQAITGASVFCPTHHTSGIKGAIATPLVELAISVNMAPYRTSWFAKHTKWSEVVDQAMT